MRNKATEEATRFWSFVERTESCWLWRGAQRGSGYGGFHWRNISHYAHRKAWELINGPIADGLHVCHHCDNPPCVRPDHLFLGTQADNNHDRDRKGRSGLHRPDVDAKRRNPAIPYLAPELRACLRCGQELGRINKTQHCRHCAPLLATGAKRPYYPRPSRRKAA
jgi:hypothetical protein